MASSPQQDLLYILWLGICWNFLPSAGNIRIQSSDDHPIIHHPHRIPGVLAMRCDEAKKGVAKDRVLVH